MKLPVGQRVITVYQSGGSIPGTVVMISDNMYGVTVDPEWWWPDRPRRRPMAVYPMGTDRLRPMLGEQCVPFSIVATADLCEHDRPRLRCLDGRCWQ